MTDTTEICLRLGGTSAEVRAALSRLMAQPRLAGDADFRQRLEIVLAEVLNNIVEHAYPTVPGRIDLQLTACAAGMTCRIADQGLPMPGLEAPLGLAPSLGGADLPEGGFGWFLIRSLCTELQYRRDAEGNELTLIVPWRQ